MMVSHISHPVSYNLFILPCFMIAFLFYTTTAWAAPGDPCANNGAVEREGGQTLVCDGSTWNRATEIKTNGQIKLRIAEETDPCTNAITGQLRFNSDGSTIDYCNGSNWITITKILTHLTDVNAPNPGDGTLLSWDAGSSTWVPACSNYPDDFGFTSLTGKELYAVIESNIQRITGLSCADTAISRTGDGSPSYRICADELCNSVVQNWTSTTRTIQGGQYVQMRLTTSSESLTTHTATLTIGTISRSWSVTTRDVGTFKRVFVAADQFTGALGGIAGADQICQDRAVAKGYAGTFYAWLATDSTDDPESRFTKATIAYRDPLGEPVAYDWASLTSGGLAKYFNQTDDNFDTSFDKWTNVAADGTAKYDGTNNCLGWTSNSNLQTGHVGRSLTTGVEWTDHDLMPCDSSQIRLICVQQ